MLVYRIPSEPTRLRATVWRRLKALGAIYLQNSVAALPADVAPGRTEAEAALKKCEQALESYASRVYAEEPEGH